MKKSLVFLAVLLLSISISAQSPKYSVGIIGSHIHNNSSSDRISEANNPFGYGIVLASIFTDELSIDFTFEYLKDNLEFENRKEENLLAHYSLFLHPFKTEYVHPYLSAGVVYTHRTMSFDAKADVSEDLLNGRFSVGVDVPIVANWFINGDQEFIQMVLGLLAGAVLLVLDSHYNSLQKI